MCKHKLAILLISAALAAGCAQKTKPDEEAAREGSAEAEGGFATQPLEEDGGFADGRPVDDGFGAMDEAEMLLGRTTIYFDFDSSSVKAEYSEAIAAHAEELIDNPGVAVRLEGHTDERGSREYNIGLGERRAQAVRQAMLLQGVPRDQLSTVSYGEEQPAVTGDDEEAWAMNRRVEIVYQQ